MEEKKRASFSGSIGFVLAAAGSAVGLGNIWKFPYLAGSNGGGYFLVIYIAIVLLIGWPCMLSECTIGRAGRSDASKSFSILAAKMGSKNAQKWGYGGFIGVLASFVIMTYYPVVGGWVLQYIVKSFTAPLASLNMDVFGASISSSFSPIIFTAIFCIINFLIVYGGVEKGIEKANKIMLPSLFIMLVIVLIRALTIPGAMEGIKFLWVPSGERLLSSGGVARVALAALGQAFFSLSLGQGIMVTYGSYLPKDTSLVKSSVAVCCMDTLVAITAGSTVMAVVFAFGMEPSAGPGLLFGTLPMVFNNFGPIFGPVFSGMFFLLTLFAALTSSISLLEVITAFMVDTFGWARKKALLTMAGITFVLCCINSLSNGILSVIQLGGMNLFDAFGFLSDKILLPVASLIVVIFIGWVWKPQNALKEMSNEGTLTFSLFSLWSVLVQYILPVAIAILMITGLLS